MPLKNLFKCKRFYLFFILILCAGACEQAMSQWVSYFAEKGLNLSKTLGDLVGPFFICFTHGIRQTFLWTFRQKNKTGKDTSDTRNSHSRLLYNRSDKRDTYAFFNNLRAMRSCGQHNVAGGFGSRFEKYFQRRNRYVRHACFGRRYRLHFRT